MDKILHLHLKAVWFNMIESGEKKEEYRENNDYYFNRIAGHAFTHVKFYYGYNPNKTIIRKIKKISLGFGNPLWGAPTGGKYL